MYVNVHPRNYNLIGVFNCNHSTLRTRIDKYNPVQLRLLLYRATVSIRGERYDNNVITLMPIPDVHY